VINDIDAIVTTLKKSLGNWAIKPKKP
jgi:hypothetical protein